jgi:hypothetical protein
MIFNTASRLRAVSAGLYSVSEDCFAIIKPTIFLTL